MKKKTKTISNKTLKISLNEKEPYQITIETTEKYGPILFLTQSEALFLHNALGEILNLGISSNPPPDEL